MDESLPKSDSIRIEKGEPILSRLRPKGESNRLKAAEERIAAKLKDIGRTDDLAGWLLVLTKLLNAHGISAEKVRDEVSFHASLNTLGIYKIAQETKLTENPVLGILYTK